MYSDVIENMKLWDIMDNSVLDLMNIGYSADYYNADQWYQPSQSVLFKFGT